MCEWQFWRRGVLEGGGAWELEGRPLWANGVRRGSIECTVL